MGEQESKTSPGVGMAYRKAGGGWIWWKYYVLMYENVSMRHIETILRMGGGRIKENNGVGETNYDILRALCMYPW
jgi:hypothetical protein